MKKGKLISLLSITIIFQSLFAPIVSFTATNNISKTATQSVMKNETITFIKINNKAVTFKKPVYLYGKSIQIPANEFFDKIGLKPEISKITNVYTIKFDGMTIKFDPKTGKGSTTFNNNGTVIQLNNVSLIKNNTIYLCWPNFPMHNLGVAFATKDIPGVSNSKEVIINTLTTGLGSVVKTFNFSSSDNVDIEWKQVFDPQDPLKVTGSINLKSTIIANQALNLLDAKTGENFKQSPYMQFSYNNKLITTRPVNSSEISVFEMELYQNGNSIVTFIDCSPPKYSSGAGKFVTPVVKFDEIRIKSYYINVNDCKERLSGISIAVVSAEQLLAELKQCTSYNWVPWLDSDQIDIATYIALNRAATISSNSGYLPINRYASIDLAEINNVIRKESSKPSMGASGANFILSSGMQMFILFNDSNMPTKILYIE